MKLNLFSAIRQHRAAIDAKRKLENMRAASMMFDDASRTLPIQTVLHKTAAFVEAHPGASPALLHEFANHVSRQADKLAREVA